MKIYLDTDGNGEILLSEGGRTVGTLRLQFTRPANAAADRRAATSPATKQDVDKPSTKKARKKRKPLSPETKARMAAAQQKRWEEKRGSGGK